MEKAKCINDSRSIHSNNIIERMNKEIRRRIKIIDSLPTEDSALKIVYLKVAELNEKYSRRVLNGYLNAGMIQQRPRRNKQPLISYSSIII